MAEPPKPLSVEVLTRSDNYFQEWEKLLEESARTAIEKAAAQFSSSQLTVTTTVLKGQAGEAILEEAENYGADLIVLGSRGLGGFERLLLGSVSQAVVTQARCSVQIVR